MTHRFETEERRAFELLSDAIHDLESYRGSRDRRALDSARTKIHGALKIDPEYLRAVYYEAIVDDLIGQPMDAARKLETVLEFSRTGSPFEYEVRYNLGVAYYHRYSWSCLDKAISEFAKVIDAPSHEVDDALRLAARAARAQAHAMYMIPPTHDPDEDTLRRIEEHRKLSNDDVENVLHEIEQVSNRELRMELEWTAFNARGMALMYWTDYDFAQPERKLDYLGLALKSLKKAEQKRPRDWANWCDMGSAHLRIAAATSDANVKTRESEFGEAVKHLEEVVDNLRPGYSFALYELGRVYRVWGKFDKAVEYFGLALQVPEQVRDVNDERIETEKRRVARGDKNFP